MNTNPFDITKAVHYTNEQLLKYWVNIPGSGGFDTIINPKSQMPMLILGSKGSGKTHILKYYSYELQRLRYMKNSESFSKQITSDGYLGLYLRAGNLNSKKFEGNLYPEKGWEAIFEYYFDLFVAQIILDILSEIIVREPEYELIQSKCCTQIISLFDLWEDKIPNSFFELREKLSFLQKQLDLKINKASIIGEPNHNLGINITGGKLILGIPAIIRSEFDFLRDVQFSYLIDEFENFTHSQQKFINTLIREIEAPTSIKIGTRLYGVKTSETYSGGETLRAGAEYEIVNIDAIFRVRKTDYSNFIKEICLNRIKEAGSEIDNNEKLKNAFELFTIDHLTNQLKNIDKISHREELSKKLLGYDMADIVSIQENLNSGEDLIIEKVSYILFYKRWKKLKSKSFFSSKDLVHISEEISRSKKEYFGKKTATNNHFILLDKYKSEIVDQLCRENQIPVTYSGIDNFIKMSAGIPRLVLLILKHVYRWSIFNEEMPFCNNSKISAISQTEGVLEAAKWFIEDAQMPGKKGITVRQSINRIGQYMQTLRYSDTPPECSICTFRIDKSIVSKEKESLLEFLQQYSYIIESKDRQDKNIERKDTAYQIIGILSPLWGLAINKRGILNFDIEITSKIFSEEDTTGAYFKEFINKLQYKYNAPFKEIQPPQKTLFNSIV